MPPASAVPKRRVGTASTDPPDESRGPGRASLAAPDTVLEWPRVPIAVVVPGPDVQVRWLFLL